jgi:hypothetical protein
MIAILADKFPVGQVVATPGALETFGLERMLPCLLRHVDGDWGDLDAHDIAVNDDALANNDGRLFSSYNLDGEKLWIITEWDRSVTTFLLPSEY